MSVFSYFAGDSRFANVQRFLDREIEARKREIMAELEQEAEFFLKAGFEPEECTIVMYCDDPRDCYIVPAPIEFSAEDGPWHS